MWSRMIPTAVAVASGLCAVLFVQSVRVGTLNTHALQQNNGQAIVCKTSLVMQVEHAVMLLADFGEEAPRLREDWLDHGTTHECLCCTRKT